MAKKGGAKPKGKGSDSNHFKGYQAGWKKIKRQAEGMEPQKAKQKPERGKSQEYKEGERKGKQAARRYFLKK